MQHHSTFQRHAGPQPHALSKTGNIRRIGIAFFDGFKLSETASIAEVFHSANAVAEKSRLGGKPYELCLLSIDGGKIDSSSAASVCTEAVNARREADELHALFIAGGAAMHAQIHDDRLITWLRQVSLTNERIYSIGTGVLLMAATGPAQHTTARKAAADAGDRPRSPLGFEPTENLTDPQRAALRVVLDDLGPEVVRQIVGEPQAHVPPPFNTPEHKDKAVPGDEAIHAAVRWLEAHSDRPVCMRGAAHAAGMSERTFLRRFKLEMGLTPSGYLLKIRLGMSCRLLAETDLPADKIARRCGLASGGNLARLFRAHFETTPITYRTTNRRNSIHRSEHA